MDSRLQEEACRREKSGRLILVTYTEEAPPSYWQTALSRERGDRVHFAASGEGALRFLEEAKPALLFYHLWTSGLSAFGLLDQLASWTFGPPAPVVVYGALPPAHCESQLEGLGAAGYLHQPFTRDELLAARDVVLRGGSYYRGAEKSAATSRSRGKGRKRLGKWGESVAAHYLEAQGYEPVARNWRCVRGELDLIMRAGELLVFVEVKTRRGRGMGTPEEGFTSNKADKVLELAQHYLYEQGLEGVEWRVDLVAVELDAKGKLLRCEHIPGAARGW